MDQLTASASTRSAAGARRRVARARRRVAAGVAALLSTIGIVAAVPQIAVAQTVNNCGAGVVTCGTVDKEVVNPKPVYQVGESVTYRLTLQCSSLEGNCGIGTMTDVFDPNLTIPAGAVVLPNPLPYPMSYTWAGNTLTLKLGNATTAWPDGPSSAVYVTAIVKDYPLTAPVGVINNQATLTVTKGSSLNSVIVPINVAQPDKDFGLTKSSATGIAPGETYSFQMKFTRPTRVGGIDVTSAVVTDPLPADLEYVTSWAEYASAGWTTSYDSGSHTVTWNLTSIPARDSINCDAEGLNCTSYTTLYVTVKVPPNARQSAVPPAGTVYTNTASAVLTYKDGGTETVTATGTLSTAAPQPGTWFWKEGPAKIAPGGNIRWRVYAQNTGNMTLTDATITDALPTNTLQALTLDRVYWDYNPLAPRGGLVTFQFSSDGGATWGSTTVIDSNVSSPLTIPVPAGSTHWRMSTPTLKPGQFLTMYVTATVPAGTSLDDTITNCATMTSTTPGFTAPAEKCVTTNVDPAEAYITPIKGLKITGPNAPTSVTPLEVFDWIVGFAVKSSIPVKTMTVSDVIPPQFEVIGVTCFSTRGTGSGEGSSVIDAPCPSTRPIPDHTIQVLSDGSGTLVTFKDMVLPADTLAGQNTTGYSLHIEVRVKPGTSVADYTNTVKVNTNDQITTCDFSWGVQTETTDPADIDGDKITDELVCTNKAVVKVIEAETVQVRKWDIGNPDLGNIFEATGTSTAPAGADETVCPDWDGYTRYPCVAQTLPGGSFSYRVEMQNVGNVPMTNYVLYDVLPVIGDTGVGQLLSGGQRATEWSPVLTGPVVLNSALSTATNSGYVVEYNLTSNPCRPELNIDPATPDAAWQTSCDNNWLNEGDIVDWTSVKSYRIKLFQQANGTYPEWGAGQTLVFTVPMKAPLNAPQSVFEPLDLSVAWNSVAYRGYRVMAGSDPKWLKPSEPRKVGIVVPFTIPPAVSVGDYFWFDADKDGIQDAGELPVKNAVVRLLNADGTEELGATTTNENGYYSFVNLVPDTDYIIEFVNPDPAAYTFTKQDAGADTSNSRTEDLTDSDVAVATGRVSFNSGPAGENLPGGPTEADAGTDNPGLDAGLVEKVKFVSVGDYVWYDLDRDGAQDSAEPVYAGMTVQLLHSDGSPVLDASGNARTTTTDAGGYYSFTDLEPSTAYVIKFVKKADESFTTTNSSGDSTNSPTADLTDSDAAQADGTVAFTTTATGSNLASSVTAGVKADNPGIDAGIVRYNLVLDKALTSSGPYYEGGTVTYTLTPSNEGPVDALKGWSVTDILPAGLTLVSMVGTGYDCTTTPGTCVSKDAGLAAGQKGNVITVTATIDANVTGDLKNVAYVDKAPNDADETIPLGDKPTVNTDTTQLNTDNDDEQKITVLSKVSIGDYVWLDVNRDGLQASEAGIAGVTVTLTDAAGATRSTTTDASGYYWFDDLTPGAAYTLTFTKPTGYVWTTQNVAGATADQDAGTDSDVNPADGKVSFTAPTSGSNRTGALVTDNPTLDAGLIELVSVGDYTWLDVNRDGIQDAGEAPLAGVTVNLYNAAGGLVATKTTDAAGYYWFTDLLAGATYTIEFVKPAGYTYTPVVNADPTANKDGGLDSDAPVTDGKVTFVAEATGSNAAGAKATDNPTIDAGFVELVSIGDYVWYDRNRDGLQGAVADEPVVAGVVVNLYAADGTTLVKTTTTNASGFYSFTDLLAGATYVVEFVKPVDTVFTQANALGNAEDTKDSDANVSTGRVTVVAPSTGANSATTPDNPTIDAGLIELVSIGNYVWYDRNRDGQQSAGEPAVPGVVVNLTGPDGFSATTTTDANGFYSFNNLIGGVTYTVEFLKPADTIFTSQNTGVDVTDSDADVVTGKVTVPAPVTGNNSLTTPDDPTIDAGLIELVSVGDYVWWDTNRDGLQDGSDVPLAGVVVHLLDAAGNPAVLPGGAPVTATTNAAGAYWFTNLIAGVTYQVKFDTPKQYVATTSNVSGDTSNSATADLSDSDPIAGVVTFTAPVTGDNKAGAEVTDNPGLDAGFIKLVSVGDYVWYDANRDGVQSDGELPVEGVVVNLYDKDGKLVDSATTNADGFYSFINLLAGATYTIEFVKPDNTIFTAAEAGAKDVDSNADVVSGKFTFPAPTDGVNSATAPDDPTIDAGLIELVSIGDYVWWDRDLDGLQSEGEPVVAGVTVNLLDADGKPAVLPGGAPVTTTTNDAGFYSFTNLVAGVTYQVQFVKPADTIFTSQDVEGDVSNDTTTDVADSDADEVTGLVTVVAPATGDNSATAPDNPTIDAGLIELVSVGNYVWLDINRDGLQSEGEPVVADVTVNLLDVDGNPAVLPGEAPATTKTNKDGYYSFNNLIGGVTYWIEFVTPEGKVLTFQDVEGDTSNSIETDVADSDADQLTGLVEFVAPVTGDNLIDPMQVDNPTIDAGLVTLVSVGDYVWYDVDRDGVQDQGEAPVPGVTVNLYDEFGELLATATTDENGFYSFTDLWAGATYTIEFVKPVGTSFTTMGAGEDDTVDSNADLVSGMYTFQAPADGSNSATTPDDPTIDAGLVEYNLTLTKVLTTTGVVYPGDTVTFTLTPHNDGPVNALAGWSVTEVVPAGLTLVSMAGDGYTCTGTTCVAADVLAAGANGNPITVTMTVGTTGSMRNIAFVDKEPTDGPETNPLDKPTTDTDTTTSRTDNDAEAAVIVSPRLPNTGSDTGAALAIALGLMAAGGLLLVATRRRRSTQE